MSFLWHVKCNVQSRWAKVYCHWFTNLYLKPSLHSKIVRNDENVRWECYWLSDLSTLKWLCIIVIIIVRLAPIQCIAPFAANNLQSGLSSASSVASSTLRLWYDRLLFTVAIQYVWERPVGLFQSLWGTAVRILLASADSSILAKWPNSIRRLCIFIINLYMNHVDSKVSQKCYRVVFFSNELNSSATALLLRRPTLCCLLLTRCWADTVWWSCWVLSCVQFVHFFTYIGLFVVFVLAHCIYIKFAFIADACHWD